MKKQRILILASVVSLFASCTNEQLDNQLNDASLEGENSNNVEHVCLDVSSLLVDDVDQGAKALITSKLWENGQTITVKFLDGTTALQDRVITAAKEWETYANINFEVVTSGNADLRISFEQTGASWSYLGTDAARINQSNKTMNFGWFTENSSDTEIRRTTLHEFGHALGAIHEHQSPVNDIQWDVEAVYEQYERYGWSEAQVNSNLFTSYSASAVTNSAYDPESIMHYPISNNLTLNNFSVDYNTELSDLDKQFIGITYPFSDDPTEEPEEEEETEESTTESGDNVALGRSTSQSSTGYSGVSSRAVDGNTSGVWRDSSVTHTNTTAQPWWKVDLDETTSIGEIIIYNRTDTCCTSRLSNFYVDVLNESGGTVGSLLISNAPSPSISINGNGIQGKSVRIRLAGTNPLSLAEVQVIQQ